ncbi:MAG: hypothetical protein EOP51_14655 [Sphingobacteriales bacterium]|nr:MAG: hypothetical protein EOP51_14655 [Sphingobacteriales bacterium]
MKATIVWLSETVLLDRRPYLFCFGEKCMSGKITTIEPVDNSDEFVVWVDFIEPMYFEENIVRGNSFTVNEASVVLANGKVL